MLCFPTPSTNFYQVVGSKTSTYNFTTNGGWCADYFDPYDYLNVLFDGRNILPHRTLFEQGWNVFATGKAPLKHF